MLYLCTSLGPCYNLVSLSVVPAEPLQEAQICYVSSLVLHAAPVTGSLRPNGSVRSGRQRGWRHWSLFVFAFFFSKRFVGESCLDIVHHNPEGGGRGAASRRPSLRSAMARIVASWSTSSQLHLWHVSLLQQHPGPTPCPQSGHGINRPGLFLASTFATASVTTPWPGDLPRRHRELQLLRHIRSWPRINPGRAQGRN